MYEVDTGLHHHGVIVNLPAKSDGFPFYAWVDIEWRVTDAETVVRDRVDDVIRALVPSLRREMASATREHAITAVEAAEQAALDALVEAEAMARIGARYGVTCSFWVRLSGDRAMVHHTAAKRDLVHQLELESSSPPGPPAPAAERSRTARRPCLRLPRVHAGRTPRPGRAAPGAQPGGRDGGGRLLRTERHDERQQAIDFITKLAKSDVIEKSQAHDMLTGALRRLQESVDHVVTTEAHAIVDRPAPPELPAAGAPGDSRRAEPREERLGVATVHAVQHRVPLPRRLVELRSKVVPHSSGAKGKSLP